jgi:hypothetical protein
MPTVPPQRAITPTELSILRVLREADEDHGGLFPEELTDEEAEVCHGLVARGWAEVLSEFGQAPDGEEDERDAGARAFFRITGRGVDRLADSGREPTSSRRPARPS